MNVDAPAPLASQNVSPQVVELVKRSRFNPIRHLKPELLSKQLDMFEIGFIRDFALMAAAIKRRDYMISVTLRKREKAIARHGYEVVINDGLDESKKADAAKHQAALRYFWDNIRATNVLDQNQKGGFRLLVQQMMESVGFRYAVHEVVYRPTFDPVTNAPRLTATFNYVPLSFFEATTGKLRFIKNYFGSITGEAMDDEGWLVTVGEGLMEPLAVCYMFKSMSLKDWLNYNERFGMPGVHATTTAAKDTPPWNDVVDAVSKFAQEYAVVTSQDAQIKLIETKGGTGDGPFHPLIQAMDRAIATLCRGADLSTISSGAHSQGHGASLQGDEADVLEEDDAELISETLNQIDRVVIRELFGTDEVLAKTKIIVPERKNNADIINKFSFLLSAGVEIGVDYARQELAVPAPGKGEELLQKPAPILQQEDLTVPETPKADLGNASANGREAIFKANAAAQVLAAKRDVFRPVALRIAALANCADPAALALETHRLKADASHLYHTVMASAPDLASPLQEIIGTALIGGFAEAAKARKTT
ncbi:MAG TPA: DUF935 family protein [Opitutaceae bacterium]|jgi:phage gp29-like protein|nr:DUF935 family protein [Opitutaceae bacterium]